MNQTTRWARAQRSQNVAEMDAGRAGAKAAAKGGRGPEPPVQGDSSDIDWRFASEVAIVCIAVVVAVTALFVGRAFFMPVLAAIIVGITLSPVQKWAANFGVPSVLTAVVLVLAFCGLLWLAATLVGGALADWIAQAPELGDTVKEKLRVLERPIGALRDLMQTMGGTAQGEGQKVSVESSLVDFAQQAIGILRPALTEFFVFVGTLLFLLASIQKLRRQLIVRFGTREARLRVVRIWSDIEHDLIAYLGTVTAINVGLGVVTAVMLHLLGFANPIALGVLAFALNYIPYIGPGLFAFILLVIGFVTYPTLGGAVMPAVLFVGLNVIEGNIITPSVVGRRLTLSPFFVFVALAFWTWLWGPVGALMATPLLIVCLVLFNHMFPREEMELPK